MSDNVVSLKPNTPICRTICVKCTFHRRLNDSRWKEDQNTIWYNQFCTAPAVERKLTIDPVTGEKSYHETNSFGQTYFTDERFPYCRDINTNGDCPHYVEKKR